MSDVTLCKQAIGSSHYHKLNAPNFVSKADHQLPLGHDQGVDLAETFRVVPRLQGEEFL